MLWPYFDAAYPNTDLLALPLHQYLNYLFAWLPGVIEKEKWEQFVATLDDPLDGEDAVEVRVSESTLAREQEDFMALMQMQSMTEGA